MYREVRPIGLTIFLGPIYSHTRIFHTLEDQLYAIRSIFSSTHYVCGVQYI